MEEKTESTEISLDNSEKVTTLSFRESLSEEYRDNKALANFATADDLVKSYLNAQSLVGKKVSDLSADELKAIDKKLGMPETAADYNFEADEAFKNKAHAAGLSHVHAKKLYEAESKARIEAALLKEKDLEDSVKSLEDLFGSQLEAKIALAKKAALELGGDDLYKGVFDGDGKKDIKLIKALSEAGKRLFGHESVGTDGDLSSSTSNLDHVQQEISNHMTDKEFMKRLSNPGAVGHSTAKAIITKLYSDKAKLLALKG